MTVNSHMARTPTITVDQVAAAANGLLAKGVVPTARSVREVLGMGSMATVLKHFQAWQGTQARPSQEVSGLLRDLERLLLDFLGREVAASKGALESDLAASQQANADLIAESERQAILIEELTASAQDAGNEVSSMAGRLTQLEADFAQSREEAQAERNAAELVRTELAKAMLRLEAMPRLESEIEQLRQTISVERSGRTAAEQQAAVAVAKFEAEQGARAQLAVQYQNVSSQLLEATKALGDERVANRIAAAQIDDKNRELAAALQADTKSREALRLAEQEAAELRGRMQQISDQEAAAKAGRP